MNTTKGKERFSKGKSGVDDKVECYYGNPRFCMKPLEVMFSPYLKRSRFCEGKMCGWLIEGTVEKLPVR